MRKLEKEGVKWQPQVEENWLADVVANNKAVALLLRFLRVTEVEKREGAKEREME